MAMYRPRLNFVRANAVKRQTKVETAAGTVVANAGDYVVIFPNDVRTVLQKAFFESMYEDAEDTVFCDVCMDFDGVWSTYVSGWQGAGMIVDPPVPGVFETVRGYLSATPPLTIAVHSARSAQADGILAMRSWIDRYDTETRRPDQAPLVDELRFPFHKPAAKVYLDDRGVRFTGEFPSANDLIHQFSVWNEADKKGRRLITP